MQMAEQFDISTLAWVKGEIDETLKQARVALEAYVDDSDDESQLEFCISYVHQVYGTLHMVELQGAALFAEDVEKFAVSLRDDATENSEQNFELLMRAILQLPDYLESLLAGQQDNPISLLPLLNEMRSIRGAKVLEKESYFNPSLNVDAPELTTTPPANITTQLLAKKVHPYLMPALAKLIKGTEQPASLKTIATVLEKLLQVASGTDCRRMLWVASAFLEGLRDGSLELSKESKPLLGKIEQQVRALVASGEDGLVKDKVDALLKGVLYQLAHSAASGSRAAAVKQAFKLSDIDTGETSHAAMGGVNAELKQAVSADIMEELSRAKDVFDIYVRSDRNSLSSLEPMVESLGNMAETLNMLQEDKLCSELRNHSEVIKQLLSGELEADDTTLMGIAGAILSVESALRDWGSVSPVEKADAADEQVSDAEASPEAAAEHQRVIRQVMKEARDDLIKVREAVNNYLEKPEDKHVLEIVPVLLHQVIGGLNVLSYKRVAQILNSCNYFVQRELIAKDALPEAKSLDALADVVMSIEYYLEAFVQSRVHPGSVLEVAENAVTLMGYPIGVEYDEEAEDELAHVGAISLDNAAEEESDISTSTIELELEPEPTHQEASVELEEKAEPHISVSKAQSTATVEVDDEILEIFVEEAEEEIERITHLLPKWASNQGDQESITDMRRSFHTLKGSGRLVGAGEIGEFAWAYESLLNKIIDGSLVCNATVIDMLEQAAEILPSLVEHFKGGPAPSDDAEMLRLMAEEIIQPGGVKVKEPVSPTPVVEEVSESPLGEPSASEAPDLDPVLLDIYSKEAQGHLEVIEEFLARVDEGASRKVDEPIIRALHTLKGSSNMAGVSSVAAVTASLERYCKTLQALQEKVSDEGLEAMQACVKYTTEMLDFLLDRSLPRPDNAHAKQLADAAYAEVEHLEHIADAKPEAGLASIGEEDIIELGLTVEESVAEPVEIELLETEAADLELGGDFVVEEIDLESGDDDLLEMALDAVSAPDEMSLEFLEPEIELVEPTPVQAAAQAPVSALFEGDYDEELLDIFLEEGIDILDASEQTLQEWIDNPGDRSLVEALQRQLHTLKGGARMAGITPIGDLSHSLESTIDDVVDGILSHTPQMMDLLQLSHDRLVTMLEQVRDRQPVISGDDLIARVELLANPQAAVEEISVELPVESKHEETIELLDAIDEIELLDAEPLVEEIDSTIELEIVDELLGDSDDTIVLEMVDEADESDIDSIELEIIDDVATTQSESVQKPLAALDPLFEQLAESQVAWQRDLGNNGLFVSLRDAVDTLSRGCHATGITPLIDIIDAVQVLVSAIVDGHVATTEKVGDLFTLASERMLLIVNQQREQKPLDDGLFLVSNIRDLIAEGLAREEGINDETVVEITAAKSKSDAEGDEKRRSAPRIQQEVVRVRADLLDDLVNFAGEVSIYRSRVEQQIGTFGSNLGEMDQTIVRLREQLRQVEIETEAQIDSRRAEAQKQGYDDFDPLEFDRFTDMQTLSRSMAESLNDLLSIEGTLRDLSRETETLLLQQARVNTELQENLMHTRMVPMSESAPRLRRVVRQTASELDKRTTLTFEGAEVEMDRNVVERMMAPLEHMLRNSIAHGIEDKAGRKAAGKPAGGNINIALTREGSEIVIRVTDDGAGINIEVVKKKAIDRELMLPDAQLSDKEIMHFILESGFSTAAALSQVAGRGVGMDVVNSEIKQLGGVLEIDSEFGKGSLFTVRLPLTLSVSRALLVHVDEDIYAIPLPSISGIERIAGAELETLLDSDNSQLTWVGEEYNVMHLTNVLGAGKGMVHLGTKQPLILAHSGTHRIAFAVDGLIGSREIVVKSLGPQLSTLQDLAGATILADGSVALIIDMPALVRRGLAKLSSDESSLEQKPVAVVEREPVVMVVDDSITVRKVTERLLKRNNMKCVTAKDGVDAITVLDEVIPDVMLLDIEMPRMDGFELATHMRNAENLKQIPIIMITSRTGDKHRDRAMSIGVNEYMGKPYTEVDLMANIEKMLGQS